MADEITTVAALEAAYPQLVGQIRTTASETATTTERSRIQKILQRVPAGCETIAQACAFTAPVSASDAIEQMWEHQQTQGAAALQQHRNDAPAPVTPAAPEQTREQRASSLSPALQQQNEERTRQRALLRTVR